MTERTQNIAVGLTVVVALVFLAAMVLMFTGLPELFQRGYQIRMAFERTGDVQPGDPIYLAGMTIGRVTEVSFADPTDVSKGVIFVARIDSSIHLPGNVQGHMFTRGIAGTPYLALIPDGPSLKDPATGKVLEYVPTDRVITVAGIQHAGGAIPEEVLDALKNLSTLAGKADALLTDLGPALRNVREMSEKATPVLEGFGRLANNLNALFEAPPPGVTTAPAAATTQPAAPTSRPAPSAGTGPKGMLAKLGAALDGLSDILGDPENRQNMKAALASLAATAADAREALAALKGFSDEAKTAAAEARQTLRQLGQRADSFARRGEDLAQKLITDAEKLSGVLSAVDRVVVAIEKGQGTAGQLLNDNRLYESLLAASKELTATLTEFRKLLEEWGKSGVPLKLK